MTVRVIHAAGIGEHAAGAVVEMEDHRARRLILIGYVVEVKSKAKKDKE